MEPVLCYRLNSPLTEAEATVRAALQKEGFGILTEVDVTAVLRAKLGVETKPYEDAEGHTTVCLQNPDLISATFHTHGLEEAGNEARERLDSALRSVAKPV
mgnify:CR=1 FL=1